MLEVEIYRRAAMATVGRRIIGIHAPDGWYLKRGTDEVLLAELLVGSRVEAARRVGKLLVLDTDGPRLGLRFGMTGRLVVDGEAPIEALLHASSRDEAAWDRFGIELAGGGALVIRDPRRLGGVELDPDETRLGPDAGSISLEELRAALGSSTAPVKARLLDQRRIAGLGNLLVDEILWRAGLAPWRPARDLGAVETRRLRRSLRDSLDLLEARGGSHAGDLQPARVRGGACPRDGESLRRDQIGGRTTYWCPLHQR